MSKSAKPVVAGNYTITLHRADHPGDRSSYTIAGRTGNVVFASTQFKDGKPPAFITLGCEMVEPKVAAPKVAAPKVAAPKPVAPPVAATVGKPASTAHAAKVG